jgi:hypothetical protein
VNALELAELIASLLRDELDDAIVDDAREDGPLFAIVRLRGSEGRFAVTVEESP